MEMKLFPDLRNAEQKMFVQSQIKRITLLKENLESSQQSPKVAHKQYGKQKSQIRDFQCQSVRMLLNTTNLGVSTVLNTRENKKANSK